MGGHGAGVQLQRHMAARNQHRHDGCHLLDDLRVLQHSQNRDATAIQAKLDELIRASDASNQLIRAEQLTEAEVEELRCDEPPELRGQKGSRTSVDIAA